MKPLVRCARVLGAVFLSVTAVFLAAPAASADEAVQDDSIWGIQAPEVQPQDSIWG
jgi:hypothetical protein